MDLKVIDGSLLRHTITQIVGESTQIQFMTEGAIEILVFFDGIQGVLEDVGETSDESFGYATISFGWRKPVFGMLRIKTF